MMFIARMAAALLFGTVAADHDVYQDGTTEVMEEWYYIFPKIIQSSTNWIPDTTDTTHQIFTGFQFNIYNGESATNTSVYLTNSFGITFETPYKYAGGAVTTSYDLPDVMKNEGFYFMHTYSECWYEMIFTDTNSNQYISARTQCTEGGKGIYMTHTDTAGVLTAYNVDSEATRFDLSTTYTWDGSYVDPTYCDNETQKTMVDDEFTAQENRCILNGFLCSWAS